LKIIEEKGFSPYFLVMDDIVRMSPRTCGRGSGAASIVSYSLGITNVEPIRQQLYFERFLNPARVDPPDVDVDFAWDERDDLIKRVIERFGPDRCARVANHNTFRYRSALRETAKAYGFGDAEISRIERQVFHFGDCAGGYIAAHTIISSTNSPEGADKSGVGDPLWQEILTIAGRIEGLPRGLGMHCGGLVITPEPIHTYAPIETSLEGYPLLSWEKDGAEAAGFVKIDLLGNRSLAVIRDALKNLEEQGIVIDQSAWHPIEDGATIAALARGDSMGVFYIESPAMRLLQKKTGAGDFAHIVIHSSIIRPAANKFINEYVRRLKGGEWKPLHPRLEKILNETYGILCYQEDVSKTAVALADFDEAEADMLRKVIAKKAGAAKLAAYERQFFEGCRKNGVEEETIQAIWAMMLSFDGYSFCKPHSASYAMVSFHSAYLRVHHPGEFMAAVLSNHDFPGCL
jgi:DNA polymerase-3 subunit alpha/error-prone DNA polymerase